MLDIQTLMKDFLREIEQFFKIDTQALTAKVQPIFRYGEFIVLIILIAVALKIVYRIWLPRHVARKYGISRLPKQTVIKRRMPGHNSYVLQFPCWQYANGDGTRDMRRKDNRVEWKNSCLLIDSYQIFMKNPLQMVRLVRHLREQGIDIAPCSQELEKRQLLHQQQRMYSSGSSKQLHHRFQSNPFEFEEYCAMLFRAMGKDAKTTQRTNDGGYDVIVHDTDGKYGIVECKCYAVDSKIGRPMLQKLVGACMAYPRHLDYIIFITTSDFSDEAKKFAQDFQKRENISFGLINGKTLEDLSKTYLSESFTSTENNESWTQWQLKTEDLKEWIPADLYSRF